MLLPHTRTLQPFFAMDLYLKHLYLLPTKFDFLFSFLVQPSLFMTWNFPVGADSSNEGAKLWFSVYYKYQKSPQKLFFP